MCRCGTLFVMLSACALAAQPTARPLADGIARLENGDAAGSLPLLRRAVELDPRSAPAHNYLGFALGRTGSVSQAISEFRRALELDPRYPDALYNLGTALMIDGQYTAAVQNLQ